jgi:hypothetical protein
MATSTEIYQSLSDLVGKYGITRDDFLTLLSLPSTGGPGSDGYFSVVVSDGSSVLVPSLAKLAALNTATIVTANNIIASNAAVANSVAATAASASAAAASASLANTYSFNANTFASAAAASSVSANTSAANANTSAANANTSAANANTSAANANTSAASANTSAANAANSAASVAVFTGANGTTGGTTGKVPAPAATDNVKYLRGDSTWGVPSAGGGTGNTTNYITFNNSGTGAASGNTFNGGAALTISYNSIGAQVAGSYQAAGSYQTLSSNLTAYAGANWSAGVQVPTLTAANTIALKTVGAAAGNLLDKASGDTLYQPVGSYQAAGSYQTLSSNLTAYAGAAWSSGVQVPTLTAANTIALKTVGASSGNLLDKASGDSLYGPARPTITSPSTSFTAADSDNNSHKIASGSSPTLTLGSITAGTAFTVRFTTAWALTIAGGLSKNGAAPTGVTTGSVAANSLITFLHEGSGVWIASGGGLT